jgi:hypothetical protein
MILYVNGDSHTAAAEAVNPYAFAEDDSQYFYMGRVAHPDNLAVSWGKLLSLSLRAGFHCAAESASSNARIIRTTRDWLANRSSNNDVLVIIQWSTWEREEWLIDGTYYQINASGIDDVPVSHRQQYREYIANVDWLQSTEQAHTDIWDFHKELQAQNIKHVFFNGNSDFSTVKDQHVWDQCYIAPYDSAMTFDVIVRKQGCETVAPNSWHFGRDGHSYFHRFMLHYVLTNDIMS